ncbi:MAG: helix-turn-helix domain-containing protein [Lachnospiraceae bacterium]|nr:helix-turn-helix domain-containing protein [Lachnospiraceae bacterium]
MSIVERMFLILEEKKLRSVDLASILEVGTGQISTWKKRNTDPPAKYIARICEFLDVSYEYLLTGKDSDAQSLRYEGLSSDEEEMLALFRQLPQKEQYKLMGRMEEKIESLHDNAEDPVAAGNLLQAK